MRFWTIGICLCLGISAYGEETPSPEPKAAPEPAAAKDVPTASDAAAPAKLLPEPENAPSPMAEAMSEWVDQLGAEEYDVRLAARKKLFEAGQTALPALEKAMTRSAVKDLEIFEAAKQVIFEIKRQQYRDRFLKAKDLVELNGGMKIKLLKSGDGKALSVASLVWIRLKLLLITGRELDGNNPWQERKTCTTLLNPPEALASEYKVGSQWLVLVPRQMLMNKAETWEYQDGKEPIFVFELTVDEQSKGSSSSGGPMGFGSELP